MPVQMPSFIVWGSAGHAKVLHDVIRELGGVICCLVDNNPAATPAVTGVPLVVGEQGLRTWLARCGDPSQLAAAIAIGGDRGAIRREIESIFSALRIPLPALVHPRAQVSDSARIGAASQVLANALVAAECAIGDAVIVNHSVNVDHECVIGDGVHIAPGAVLCGCIIVGQDAFIGAGATVLPRVSIGRSARIGAGAVVTRDVPDNTTVVGVPARPNARQRRP